MLPDELSELPHLLLKLCDCFLLIVLVRSEILHLKHQLMRQLLALFARRAHCLELCPQFFVSICRFFNFPNSYANEDTVEKDHLNKVLYALVKRSLIA